MKPKNGAPRPGTGAATINLMHTNDSRLSPLQLIARIIPVAALLADYIALAALLHRPDLAARHVSRLNPADFAKPLHQHVARMAVAHVRLLGCADLEQIRRLIVDSGGFASESLELELRTLRRVADLLVDQVIVDWAADALLADRPRRRERGAA